MESQLPSPSSVSSLSSSTFSIYQLARLNCRERLLVLPILWTSRHVELLQCSFEGPSPAPRKPKPTITVEIDGSGYAFRLSTKKSRWPDRYGEMSFLIAGTKCPFVSRKNLHFYFNQTHICELPCTVFFKEGEEIGTVKRGEPPIAAQIDRGHIQRMRSDKLCPPSRLLWNEAARAIFHLRLNKITPTETLHDPYVLALLIALAQQSQSAAYEKGNKSSTFLSQVLFTDFEDKEYIHLFAADISDSFLDKLDFPAVPPSESTPPHVSIRHTTIPYKPYKTLRSRLISILLSTQETRKRKRTE